MYPAQQDAVTKRPSSCGGTSENALTLGLVARDVGTTSLVAGSHTMFCNLGRRKRWESVSAFRVDIYSVYFQKWQSAFPEAHAIRVQAPEDSVYKFCLSLPTILQRAG